MVSDSKCILKFIARFLLLPAVICNVQPPIIDPGILTQSKNVGECYSCKIFIESFKDGLERTARGKYEGGDAAWEEEKLKKSYKRSEMRLIDIQDGLCKDTKHSVQCYNMAEKSEEFIEQWWAQDPDKSADLFTYICIEKMKVCCPKGHFGKDCSPCLGDPNNLCNANGKCRGDGTRKGNGTCYCDVGYTGDNCDQCRPNFYLSNKDDKIICSPCHESCSGGCREGTQKDCVACRNGFLFDQDEGCLDVNECDDIDRCKKNQFCMNSIGSFKCMPCDKACNGCHGDGPDGCRRCAKGYSKKGEFCIPDREEDYGTEKAAATRYMTYAGLLVTTGILFPKSTKLGGLVCAMVLFYIFGAEYYCMINGISGILQDFNLMHVL